MASDLAVLSSKAGGCWLLKTEGMVSQEGAVEETAQNTGDYCRAQVGASPNPMAASILLTLDITMSGCTDQVACQSFPTIAAV